MPLRSGERRQVVVHLDPVAELPCLEVVALLLDGPAKADESLGGVLGHEGVEGDWIVQTVEVGRQWRHSRFRPLASLVDLNSQLT
jgi:hypothetical protein